MASSTGISWTHATFNPWIGCQPVSAACDHCYAEALVKRWGGDFATRRRTSAANWKLPLRWDRGSAKIGVRTRVFCSSLADVFDNRVPEEWRRDLFALIRATPHLDWQLLTKRPQNMAEMLPPDWGAGWPNVWLGTTVEDQTEAERRVPHLQATPASVRFLSCEPLLEPIRPDLSNIHWLICGGESGSGARAMSAGWAHGLRNQCLAAGVAFFMKQLGGARDKRADPSHWPLELQVQEFPATSLTKAGVLEAHHV